MNNFQQKKIKNKKQKISKALVIAFFIFCLLLEAVLFIALKIENYYQDKFFSGVYIGKINAGGKTKNEVYKLLEEFKTKLNTEGLVYIYQNKTINVLPQIYAVSDPDLSSEIITLDLDATLKQAFLKGRHRGYKTILPVWRERYQVWQNTKTIPLVYKLKSEELLNVLKNNFKNFETPPNDAQFLIDQNFKINIAPEKFGFVFNYQKILEESETYLSELKTGPIVLATVQENPEIKREDLMQLMPQAVSLFNNQNEAVIKLQNESQKFEIKPIIYKDWLGVVKDNQLSLSFKREPLEEYLEKESKPQINRAAVEPKFIIGDNNKVLEFTPSQSGLELNLQATFDKINQKFFKDPADEIAIVVNIVEPQYNIESVNNLGIRELLGTGKSNFKGSPKNRIHNIKTGAASLNGILIPPGEEFSTNKALGIINKEAGYLPELVIKGNKTIPEYGGGLCQIGTTLFRAALASGMPITERQPHAYRVVYYEPAGTDCTIYPPHPDCRFLNDTKNYILIQTKMKDNDLFFEFWGTRDERKITQTEPIVYNIVNPPATKYIETEDLETGKTKCIEIAHKGADTKFNYKIEYPDGTKKEQEFKSHYKPWQAVCLIGKKTEETIGEN